MSKRIEGDIIIKRPAEEVFDFCADERNEPRYNPRMTLAEQTSSGPIGLGSQFRAEMRTMGRTMAMTIEWTAYERPRRLASWTRRPAWISEVICDSTRTRRAPGCGGRGTWSRTVD